MSNLYIDYLSRYRENSISIGYQSGMVTQNSHSISIGHQESDQTYQHTNSVSIGYQASQFSQGTHAVSIGYQASQRSSGYYAISIGQQAPEGPYTIWYENAHISQGHNCEKLSLDSSSPSPILAEIYNKPIARPGTYYCYCNDIKRNQEAEKKYNESVKEMREKFMEYGTFRELMEEVWNPKNLHKFKYLDPDVFDNDGIEV